MFSRFFIQVMLLAAISCVASAQTMTLPDGEVLRDPTRPDGTIKQVQGANAKEYKVSYILNSAQRRYAIVNGRQVSEGDQIAGARVSRIDKHSVQLIENGKARTISIQPVQRFKKSY